MQKRDRRPADIGADRIDRAMGEIDQVGDAENQRQPDREQRIDVADDEAVDGIVDEGAQAIGRPRLLSDEDSIMAARCGA